MSPAEFLNTIVVDILKEDLSGGKLENHGGSKNTLWQSAYRNTCIGNTVVNVLSSLIESEIRFSKSKRNKISKFLEQFLTADEKEYVKNDIKNMVRLASSKIKNNKTKGIGIMKEDNFRIVTMDDLLKMGWTVEDIVNAGIELDFETIEDITEEHNGDFDQWLEVARKNSDTIRWLLDNENNVIGYWHFSALFDEYFNKAKEGKLLDSEITCDTMPILLPGIYNIYFIGICLKEEYRRKTVSFGKLMSSIVEVVEELARKRNVFINEICALAYTRSGRQLCKSIGLKYVRDHVEHGEIFCGNITDLLDRLFVKDYSSNLKELYKDFM